MRFRSELVRSFSLLPLPKPDVDATKPSVPLVWWWLMISGLNSHQCALTSATWPTSACSPPSQTTLTSATCSMYRGAEIRHATRRATPGADCVWRDGAGYQRCDSICDVSRLTRDSCSFASPHQTSTHSSSAHTGSRAHGDTGRFRMTLSCGEYSEKWIVHEGKANSHLWRDHTQNRLFCLFLSFIICVDNSDKFE